MRGLTKGEQSTVSSPRLTLFSRLGGFLVDIHSGTYIVQNVADAEVEPATIGTETTIDVVAHKLGTGRYALLTGDTSTWSYGTHRVIVTYKLSATGVEHTQVIEFEILGAIDWVNGQGYLGYASTRRIYGDGYALRAEVDVAQLHRRIREYSMLVNSWTGRMGFHPIYATLRLEGQDAEALLLEEAVIAIDQITDSYGNAYEAANYRVYNRHLDGGPDDRYNPKVDRFVCETQDGRIRVLGSWPQGNQNLLVSGVFGFTDPEPGESTVEQVSLGTTPDDLARVIGVLISRQLQDPLVSDPTVQTPGSIRSMRTRDQAVTFGGAAGASGDAGTAGAMTGDPLLDQILVRYSKPVFAQYVGAEANKQVAPWRPWP